MAHGYDSNYFSSLENGYKSDDCGQHLFDSVRREEMRRLDDRVNADGIFQAVFGHRFWDTSLQNTRRLWEIKVNNPETVRFRLTTTHEWGETMPTDDWNNEQWEQLGIYLGSNTHVERVDLSYCIRSSSATRLVPSMFHGLKDNRNIKSFSIKKNIFDSDSIRAVLPFLANNSSLIELDMHEIIGITPEVFRSLIRALHNGPIECIDLYNCSLGTVIQMEDFALPNLRRLTLGNNGLKDEDCRVLSEFIKCAGSKLEHLSIAHNEFGDEGAEFFAEALNYNASLKELYLGSSITYITEKGLIAFSKVLSDVTSIAGTYTSNHSLVDLGVSSKYVSMSQCPRLRAALSINSENVGNPHSAGRRKVIMFQLSSEVRRKTSELHGVEDSYMRPFVEMDSSVLPNAISLIGMNFGKNEMYRALVSNISSLLSLVDKDSVMKEQLTKMETKMSNEEISSRKRQSKS